MATTTTYYLADGSAVSHDPFSCECHETCALCTEVWPLARLRAGGEWEHLCSRCRAEVGR